MKRCPNCGYENNLVNNFCTKCGYAFKQNIIRFQDFKIFYQKHRKLILLSFCGVMITYFLVFIISGSHKDSKPNDNASTGNFSVQKDYALIKINHMDPKKIDIFGPLASKLTQSEKNHSLNFQKARIWRYVMLRYVYPSKEATQIHFYGKNGDKTNVPKNIQKQALNWVPNSVWQRNCDIVTVGAMNQNKPRIGHYDSRPGSFVETLKLIVKNNFSFSSDMVMSSLKIMGSNEEHPYGTKSIITGNFDDDLAYGLWIGEHIQDMRKPYFKKYLYWDGVYIHEINRRFGKYYNEDDGDYAKDCYTANYDHLTPDLIKTKTKIKAKTPIDLHRETFIK